MTDNHSPVPPIDESLPATGSTRGGAGSSTTASSVSVDSDVAGTAKEESTRVGHEAADATKQVGAVAKEEAHGVASEVKNQARDLMHQARTELTEQAGTQQRRVATGLRTFGDQLRSMADNAEDGGMAAQLVSETASKTSDIASWLDEREPGALVDELRRFARRHSGTFIVGAVVAGVVVGRLTRSIMSGDDNSSTGTRGVGSRAQTPRAFGDDTPLYEETTATTGRATTGGYGAGSDAGTPGADARTGGWGPDEVER